MENTLLSSDQITPAPLTPNASNMTAAPYANSPSFKSNHVATNDFSGVPPNATTMPEQETKPDLISISEPQAVAATQAQISSLPHSSSAVSETNSLSAPEEDNPTFTSVSASSAKLQQDRSNDDDDNWGKPTKKLTQEQIDRLNTQSYTETRAMPLRVLSLALLVVGGAIFVGLIKAWGLDPLVNEDLMLLTKYSGIVADCFGANALGVAGNYAYSAILGCLCYVIPYGVAYEIAFCRPMIDILKKDFFNGNKEICMAFLLNSLRSEVYKLALTFVMLGLCFKYGSMSKEVMICSFIALVVLVMFSVMLRAIWASKIA